MLSFDKSNFLDDKPYDDGSDYRSAGTCTFTFLFGESVGRVGYSVDSVDNSVDHVCGVGSCIFVLTGIQSIGDVFLLVVFVPKGVEYCMCH